MTTVARRSSNPMAEMLDWLESNTRLNFGGVGLAPIVRVEDYVEDGDYVVRAEIPGVDPAKDIEVTVQNGMLTIVGERREETKDKRRREFHYGSFSRSLSLPEGTDPDKITASYVDGVLEVRVPTSSEESPSVKIPVKHSE